MRLLPITICLFSVVVFLAPLSAAAQAVNFIDESGNVHFADSIDEVPMRYRDQVFKKRPEILTEEQYREAQKQFKKQQNELKKQQKAEEKNAKKLAKERERLLERQRKEQEARGAKLAKSKKTSVGPAVQADPLSAKIRRYGQE